MTVLLDSWAWIEYYRGSRPGIKARAYIEGAEDAVVSTINLAEVYRWILKFYDATRAEEERLTMGSRCTIIPVDDTIAVEAAKIRHTEDLGLGDSIIMATARQAEAKIVTGDPELKGRPEVVYIGK